MAASNPGPSFAISLKLLIDTTSKRVMFAEAGKDFVDFLFNIMSLPVGAMITILNKQVTAGCIRNIYESIENLGDSYMLSGKNKDNLLKPQTLPPLFPSMQPQRCIDVYRCCNDTYTNCSTYMEYDPKSSCPECADDVTLGGCFTFVNKINKGGGFVKEGVNYMITDDLAVRPISTKAIFDLLNKLNIKDAGDLQEKVVVVGVREGVELLRASMQSKTVLTAVFLGRKDSSVKSEAF